MIATKVEGTDPNHLDIVHACEYCKKVMRNKAASDDNKEKLFELMEN